jgi:site-specific DNA-adenine methylase
MMTSPFPHYRGNKSVSGLYQMIIGLMPKHDIYVELCLGGGAILCRKKPALLNIGNDIDPLISDRWKQLCNHVRHSHNQLYFSNCDARRVIQIFERSKKKVLFYLDLPYLKESRRSDIDIYNYESSPAVHKDILNYAAVSNHFWIISHYDSELYSTMLDRWNTKQLKVSVRGKPATEKIWFNFSGDIAKHDYGFHGTNFTQRQQHKRKLQRLMNRLASLNEADRDFLLSAVIDKFGYVHRP